MNKINNIEFDLKLFDIIKVSSMFDKNEGKYTIIIYSYEKSQG